MLRDDLEGYGSIITIKGTNRCLGDLLHFEGKGTWCPANGEVPVSKEEADAHNKALDTARIKAMDNQCEVGQGSYAYFYPKTEDVKSFIGTLISDDTEVTDGGRTIEFRRGDRVFRGELNEDSDNFFFERVQ